MPDLNDLANAALQTLQDALATASEVMADKENFTPKERAAMAKSVPQIAGVVLDRVYPKLTSSTNKEYQVDMAEMIKLLSKYLPPDQTRSLLQMFEQKLLPGPSGK